ncbi:LOW QUALITY PROTEIN: olfactory receptor 2T2-like [Erethizon dorsatum]
MIVLIQVDPRLHTPMYFLLSQLSVMDILYISTIVPKMLLDQAMGQRAISFAGCTAQHFLYLTLAGAEFFLLGLMSYDRYVAICSPLRYPVLMSRRVCLLIVAAAWLGGSVDGFLLTPVTMRFPFCASREINHFFCEVPALLKLSCTDTSAYETAMYACCILMLLIPFSVIAASYARILLTVCRMHEAEGQQKAVATCSSHMVVVSLFYGAAMYTYVLPHSYHTPEKDKAVSAFYTILTPLLNPLIYSLRNRDVAGALRKALGQRLCSGRCDMEMEAIPQNSTDFILLGLIVHPTLPGLIFAGVFSIFVVAVIANVAMALLIRVDPRLHTPMYFLLSQLSIMDTVYICVTVPKMLQDLLSEGKTISFLGCALQIFLYLTLLGAEFFLLGLMAYDRYVAVCSPLRYPALMSRRVCLCMVLGSWLGGSLDGFMLTPVTMSFPYCASREINHFFCEIPAVLRLSCMDTSLYETLMYACCVLMLLVPISVITVSYSRILVTVHRMTSAEGRRKAWTTCSSHVLVVSIFYGAAFYTNVLPHSYHSPEKDKVVSAFYTIFTPMLNPLIYSLRNKDVAAALRRVLGRCSCPWRCSTLELFTPTSTLCSVISIARSPR